MSKGLTMMPGEKKYTFEQAVSRLEEIAGSLENSFLSLEDSLKLYEEGAALAAFCNTALKEARQKMTEIKITADSE